MLASHQLVAVWTLHLARISINRGDLIWNRELKRFCVRVIFGHNVSAWSKRDPRVP